MIAALPLLLLGLVFHLLHWALPTLLAAPAGDCPKWRFSAGYETGRLTPKASWKRFVGWTSEVGKFPAFDDACEQLGLQQIEIKHANSVEVAWYVPENLSFYPATGGTTTTTMLGIKGKEESLAQSGIGNRWWTNETGRSTSYVSLRGYLAPLVDLGYLGLCQISAKGMQSDRLLMAISDHQRVCREAAKLRGQAVSPVELVLTLGCGEETMAGKGEKSSPMIPLLSQHPRVIDAAYVTEHWRPDALAVQAGDDWGSTVDWALSYTMAGAEAPVSQGQAAPISAPLPPPEGLWDAIAQAGDAERLHQLRAYVDDLHGRRQLDDPDAEGHREAIDQALDALIGGLV